MGDSALFKELTGRFPHDVTRRAATTRLRTETLLGKATAPACDDDTYAIPDGDRGIKRDPACPVCGLITNPGAMTRHKAATGHGAPTPRTENAEVAAGLALTKAAPERRYVLGVLYSPLKLDAHSEWSTADDLTDALWEYNRSGDKKLRKQHGDEVIGEVVESFVWPFAHDAKLMQADGTLRKAKLPAGTAYIGAVFTPQGWAEVEDGRRTGFSMGGSAIRIRETLPQ